MRVLMIAPTPFMADRGCHTHILLEIKALQRRGHEVLLATYGLGRDVEGVSTVRCFNPPWYRKLSAGPSLTKIFLILPLLITSLRAIAKFKPQVIHAHLHEGALIARLIRFFYPHLLYVFDAQGSLSEECVQHGFVHRGGLGHRLIRALEYRIVSWFHAISSSITVAEQLRSLGVSRSRISNLRDSVDTDMLKPSSFDTESAMELNISPDKPRVLYMGLLETYQGVDLLFEAFGEVAKEIPETQFIVIGFPMKEAYRKRAAELNFLHQIRFLGKRDYFQLRKYLSLAQVAVAPKISSTEGDGKIYSYMAMGMATVTFDRPVSREILGEEGIYARLGDSGDLAKKILWAIRHPELARAIGARAREKVLKEFSIEQLASQLETVYEEAA